ncbi:MAG: hypothetical protein AAF483_23120 [Planctomycetota bacterium]
MSQDSSFNVSYFKETFEIHFSDDKLVLFAASAGVSSKTVANHLKGRLSPSQKTVEKYATVFAKYQATSVCEEIFQLTTGSSSANVEKEASQSECSESERKRHPLLRQNYVGWPIATSMLLLTGLLGYVTWVWESNLVYYNNHESRIESTGTWEGWQRSDRQLNPDRNSVHVTRGPRDGLLIACKDMEPPGDGAGTCLWGQVRDVSEMKVTDFELKVSFRTDVGSRAISHDYQGSESVRIHVHDLEENGWLIVFARDFGNRVYPKLKILAYPQKDGDLRPPRTTSGAMILENWSPRDAITLSLARLDQEIVLEARTEDSDTLEILRVADVSSMGKLQKIHIQTGGFRHARVDTEFLSSFLYRL